MAVSVTFYKGFHDDDVHDQYSDFQDDLIAIIVWPRSLANRNCER